MGQEKKQTERKMWAAVYRGKGKISLEERKMPKLLKPTDAIINVTLTTICSSDIHILKGAVPKAREGVILGHEFVGKVIETGSQVKKFKPGDRVAVNVETFCGECEFCKEGYVNNCTDSEGGWALGCRIDGGQAEFVRIPYADQGLTKIPDTVTDEQALFTGDLLSTGYWAAQLGELKPADTVLVIGAGPAGICTMLAARLYSPYKIIAVDLDEERLELVKEQGLADVTFSARTQELEKKILEETGGYGADVVFEAAGSSDTFRLAYETARPNGIVCIIAMYEEDQVLPLPQMYGKNLIFKTGGVDACCCGEIMKLIEAGKLNAEFMITHRTTLSQIEGAYEIFGKKQDNILKWAIKV